MYRATFIWTKICYLKRNNDAHVGVLQTKKSIAEMDKAYLAVLSGSCFSRPIRSAPCCVQPFVESGYG